MGSVIYRNKSRLSASGDAGHSSGGPGGRRGATWWSVPGGNISKDAAISAPTACRSSCAKWRHLRPCFTSRKSARNHFMNESGDLYRPRDNGFQPLDVTKKLFYKENGCIHFIQHSKLGTYMYCFRFTLWEHS